MSQDIECLITDTSPLPPVPENKDETLDEQIYVGYTEQPISEFELPKKYPQYVAALAATMSALSAGLVLGWTSPILIDLENSAFRNISINTNQMGWIGSFVTLGAMTMCIPTGFICDLIGRKKTLSLLIVPFTSGWFLIYFARNVIMLYFGRLITGMAVGACCVAAPLYTSEIAHKSIRGALGSYFQLMVTIGIFLAYLFGKYLSPLPFTLLCACFPVSFVLLFAFQPETPVYLIKKGLYDDAKKSLIRLRGACYDIGSELNEIEGCLKDDTNTTVSLSQTFKQIYVRKALLISLALMFFQQFSGINVIVLYTTDIFKTSGVNFNSNTAAILVGGFMAFSTFLASLVIDKLGRRFLLIISASVIALSNFVLALYFTLKYRGILNDQTLSEIGFVPVGALCIFVIVFSLGLGPIPWMISSEIFAPEIKSICGSAAGTLNWFLAFLITKFYKQVANSVGEDSVFYAFSVLSVIGTIFVCFVVPETKGKSINEIQSNLGSRVE